ncbi:MAG: TetR/AcrR family transcriptional regulator [Pseudomonadota bacterium]
MTFLQPTTRPTTKDAIIEAAFIVFAAHPGAPLAEVATRAGVGRATLHRHFPKRADLMNALSLVAVKELDQAVAAATADAQTAAEALSLALHSIVPLANRQWFLSQEWHDLSPEVDAAHAFGRGELHATFEAAKREGAFGRHVPTRWLIEAYENLIYSAWSLVRSGDATPKQAADLAWRTLTLGLKGDTE